MNFKNRAKLKATLLSAAAIATSCLIGMSACSTTPKDDEDDDKTVTKQDVQLIKNGNFEFYDDKDGLYPISSPDNWSSNYKGNSSIAMSGVINTSKDRWDYITDDTLADTLEKNNDLDSNDENKKDFNGVLADDLPYKNPHDANKDDAKDEEKEFIANPFTHKYSYGEDGKLVDTDGKEVETYEKDGKTYTKNDDKELETSVLMLHNYRSSYFNGTETYYSSGTTVTLEARTAAKLSVWVKTCELYFDGTKNERTKVENEHGAYIQVDTTVGGNSLDSFYIRNINTEELNNGKETIENNGWIQYTVYVQASSFASTDVTLTLGLGQDSKYTVEGYAFFDDIEMTKYENAAEMIEKANEELGENKFGELTAKSTANLLSPDGESDFRVDKVTFKTNDSEGDIIDKPFEHNFADRHFYIDLTSSAVDSAIEFNRNSVAAGFTVEKTNTGRYVSSKNSDLTRYEITTLSNGAANAYLPSKNFTGRRVTDDILATIGIGGENWEFNVSGSTGVYNEILTKALSGASKLPGVENDTTTALVMLSANGAAYEAELTNDGFKLNAGEYALLTFWVKTSDMDGKTAATITVEDVNDDENNSNFSLDSTTLDPVNINDKEDIYDGWVECFIRVENTAETEKQFKLTFNFGNTTIKGTEETAYKAGWLAVANASVMSIDKDVYSYTSGLSNSASLTLSETENKKSNEFDSEQGDKNVIKTDLAIPSSYTGVNGASAEVVNVNDITDYDETNRNPYAGLLNKENLETYRKNYQTGTGCEWYSAIAALQSVNTDDVWNDFAGKYSVQPLLIVNAKRQFDEKAKAIYNYGYIGNNSSVSSNGYTAVSVKVKASKGAIANVYLVDTDASSKQVLGFSMPKYTFWYDDEGNILKGEPKEKPSVAELKENIAYTLRADGLYENGDGKLYANFYNLKKFYDYDLENEKFYDAEGNEVKFENLVQGETYYNADASAYAPHYLVAGESNKVYKYNSGKDLSATYNYMVNGKANAGKLVYGVSTEKAALRYKYDSEQDDYPYQFTIDTTTEEGAKYAGKWVTVTFYLKAGSQSKNYKLELWSGYRNEEYSGQAEGSYVLFDYNSESLSESSYKELVEFYTDAIINEYKKVVTDQPEKLSDNIADYEQLAGEKSDIFNYDAKYYTYTLYDSASYVPFNADTAKENETGYAYNYSDYSESLAYLKVEDFDGSEYSMSAFVDYSNFDKDISLGTQATVDGDDTTNTTTNTNDANFWLLLASIILLVAILVALLAIIIKDLVKRLRRNKTAGKNTYNFNKNKRYVRKYVKANGEVTKVEEGEMDESLLTDKVEEPVEETPVEEAEEAPTEETTTESTSTEEAPVEEAPSEAPAEEVTPEANEAPDEENKGDEPEGEDKQ